jgi:hypothetical protein
MSHLSSIGAGMYSDMAIAFSTGGTANPDGSAIPPSLSGLSSSAVKAALDPMFATEIDAASGVPALNSFVRIKNVREFPAMGTPPNIVNVPVFGQSTSQQIQGQADSPSMEITLNYVASDWASTSNLGKLVSSGSSLVVRFALLNSAPTGYASTALALGTTGNTYWYFIGKVDSLLVTPSLSDSNQATVAITLQSKLYGAYTV